MGTKVITSEQTIYVCDRCNKQIRYWWVSCRICKRDIGPCCFERCDVGSCSSVLIDPIFHVCKDCDEAGKDVPATSFTDLIRDKVKEADAYVLAVLERWREWAKLREKKGGAT